MRCVTMRTIAIIAACALLLLLLAQPCTADTDAERVAKLSKVVASKESGMLSFSIETFMKYIEAPGRSFSAFVFFTADGSICQPCPQMQHAVSKVAQEYRNLPKSQRANRPVFFASLKLSGADQEFLQRYGIDKVPVLYHFNPRSQYPTQLEGPDAYQVVSLGLGVNNIRQFVNARVGSQFRIVRSNYDVPFVSTVRKWRPMLIAAFVLGAVAVIRAHLYASPMFWFVTVVAVYIFSVGGGHFSWIHDTPLFRVNRDGLPEFFAGGARTQFVAEGFLVSIACVMISAFVILIQEMPHFIDNKSLQGAGGITLTLMIYFLISMLMALYHTVCCCFYPVAHCGRHIERSNLSIRMCLRAF